MRYTARINVGTDDRPRRVEADGESALEKTCARARNVESRDVAAGKTGKPEICITHYPGSMLATGRKNTEFAIM